MARPVSGDRRASHACPRRRPRGARSGPYRAHNGCTPTARGEITATTVKVPLVQVYFEVSGVFQIWPVCLRRLTQNRRPRIALAAPLASREGAGADPRRWVRKPHRRDLGVGWHPEVMLIDRTVLFRLATSRRLRQAVRKLPRGERLAWRTASRYVSGRTVSPGAVNHPTSDPQRRSTARRAPAGGPAAPSARSPASVHPVSRDTFGGET
jgi:hypothetical protein